MGAQAITHAGGRAAGCAPIIAELHEHEPRRALEIDEHGPLTDFPLPDEIRRVATIAGVLPMLATLRARGPARVGSDDFAVRLRLQAEGPLAGATPSDAPLDPPRTAP